MERSLKKPKTVLGTTPKGKKVAKPKLTRAEKSEMIRNDLFHAAAKVVGEHGYLNAMILMITQRARVANGTFYNYFDSRQDLFNQILPKMGREMLQFIAERSREGADEFEREVKRLQAFLDYLNEFPEFYRVLYEAEVFAPAAFEAHTNQVTKGYAGLLRRALNAGEIRGYSSRELDVLALILMGARYYIAMEYRREDGTVEVPSWVAATYKKFIMGGLQAISEDS